MRLGIGGRKDAAIHRDQMGGEDDLDAVAGKIAERLLNFGRVPSWPTL